MQAKRLVAFAPLTMQTEMFDLTDSPPPGKMLVEARTTMISAGTEIANYRGITTYRSAANPDWRTDPYYPGYSLAGVVRAVGEGVTGFQIGDRVCGMGPHASAAIVEAKQFVPIPEGVTFDHAAMTTLVCIVTNAVRLAKLELGESVAVVGAGMIGQLAAQLSRLSGARPVASIDPIPARRNLARTCGAHAQIDPDATAAPQQVAQLTDERGFQAVFEATGSPAALNPALKLVSSGGRLILLGSTRGLVEQFDAYGDVHLKGVTIIGAHMRTHPAHETPYNPWTWQNNRKLALRLIADGSLHLEPLISHRVTGDEGPDMFRRLAENRESFFGVLLKWVE
jgi:2-desacetyl-2-hydroxyethyl bacteriochlorophyllide A dehydrogenase